MIAVGLAIIALTAAGAPNAPTDGQSRGNKVAAEVKAGKLRYYPKKAEIAHMSGKAVLDCRVDLEGWLQDCRVASEDPPGFDFGDTALRMAPLYRMRIHPVDPASPPVRVQIPVMFKPSD